VVDRRVEKLELARLDRILDELERMNLYDLRYPPLYADLIELGIGEPWNLHPVQLLELVYVLQESHLQTVRTERRRHYGNGAVSVSYAPVHEPDRFVTTSAFRRARRMANG
jgi:hypothetical protein